jgi:nucleoid-associated protein YgaU
MRNTMSDPFAPNSQSSMLRDAQVGLLLVAMLLGLFVYVAYYRITGKGRQLPDHVRMAPVATAVWPNGPSEAPESGGTFQPDERIALVPNTTTKPVPREFRTRRGHESIPVKTFEQTGDTVKRETRNRPGSLHDFHNVKDLDEPSIGKSANPIRTDPKVEQVDFQQQHAAEQATGQPAKIPTNRIKPRGQVLNRSGLKPGDRIDASTIRRVPQVSLFDRKPAEIIVRPPQLPTRRKDTFIHVPQPKAVKPTPTDHSDNSATNVPPIKSTNLNDWPADPVPPQRAKSSLKEQTEQINNVPIAPSDTGTISRPNTFRPQTRIGAPTLRSPKPKPKSKSNFAEQKTQETGKEVLPVRNRLRPSDKSAILSDVSETTQSLDSNSFAVQQDIARSARTVTEPQPAREPAQPTTKPGEPDDNSYITKAGDSFWSVASKHYGDGRYFRALYEFNRQGMSTFDDLQAGTNIEIPDQESLRRQWPALCPIETVKRDSNLMAKIENETKPESEHLYITAAGDTLFEIAAKKLGQASRYFEIMAINQRRLPSDVSHLAPLKAGLELVLPE